MVDFREIDSVLIDSNYSFVYNRIYSYFAVECCLIVGGIAGPNCRSNYFQWPSNWEGYFEL